MSIKKFTDAEAVIQEVGICGTSHTSIVEETEAIIARIAKIRLSALFAIVRAFN